MHPVKLNAMDRLRVLFITAWYPTKEYPLLGVFVREHAKAVQLYDDVVVLHCAESGRKQKQLWRMQQEMDKSLTESIPTYRLWYRRFIIPKLWYFNYLWSVFQAFRKIVSQGFRPHIIHAHIYKAGVPAVLIGKLYRIPVVVTEHFTGYQRKIIKGPEAWTAKFALERADMVMPVSKSLQSGIEAYRIQARFQVVRNVVDTNLFHPRPFAQPENQVKRLLFVGLLDLSHKKGVPYLLNALAQLRQLRDDWLLDIVGDGPARVGYEHKVKDLALDEKVTFHGQKTKEEVAEFMRQADILVVPSTFETFSVVAAEALATGIPVLATRCGGPEEFVTDDVGLLVPPRNPSALYEGLNDMLSNLDRFAPDQISRYAKRRFSPTSIGTQIHTVYQKLSCSEQDIFAVGFSGKKIAIENQWRVLDIGSGHNPHRRADILLEKDVYSNLERSGKSVFRDVRPFVIGDALCLPFKNQSFHYAIASHVAEHTLNPILFCKEIQRVASCGYIETPGPLGELLLGEPFHLWIVRKKGKTLEFKKNTQNSCLLKIISDIFYAIFYANHNRSRWTFQPKGKLILSIFSRLTWLISKCWRSRLLRRWTYTCFEFNGSFNVKVKT